MAIKGITDKPARFFPRIAKIRLGIKRKGQGQTEYPVDVDHFVCPPEVEDVFGKNPKELIGIFPVNDIEKIWMTRMESWRASRQKIPGTDKPRSRLWCASDGETAHRIHVGDKDSQGSDIVKEMDPEKRPDLGGMFTMPCPQERCPYFENRACKPVGRLNFIMPQVSWFGIFQLETSSRIAFENLKQQFTYAMAINGGKIAGLPFRLVREPAVVAPAELKGKTTVKHVINLYWMEKKQYPEFPPPPFMDSSILQFEEAADRPEDLFPEERTRQQLPAAPGDDELSPGDDATEKSLIRLAKLAGINFAQLEQVKSKYRGDIGKIEAYLTELAAEKQAAAPPEDETPLHHEGPPQPQEPPAEEEPPHPAEEPPQAVQPAPPTADDQDDLFKF